MSLITKDSAIINLEYGFWWAKFAVHVLDSKGAQKSIQTKIQPNVQPSLYPFFSQNCLHILSNVFRSAAKQPTR